MITQAAAIEEISQSLVDSMYTMLPGEIVSYSGGLAVVRPTIKKIYRDGEELPYPDIPEVPVKILATNRGGLSLDLTAGDPGLLFFAARDCSNYINTGQVNPPETSRKYDYNDCFFIPFESRKNNIDTNYKALSTLLYRTDAGTLNFANSAHGLGELMSELCDLLDALQTIGSAGSHTASPAWRAQIIALKTKFTVLTGG